MGTKFFGFFLYEATGNVSTSGLPPHLFATLCVPVFDNSTPWPLILSRHGRDDSLPDSASLLLWQCVSGSIGQLHSRLSKDLSVVSSQAFSFELRLASGDAQELAWVANRLVLRYDMLETTRPQSLEKRLTLPLPFGNFPHLQAYLLLEVSYNPIAEVSRLFSCFYVGIFLSLVSNLFAKINKLGVDSCG